MEGLKKTMQPLVISQVELTSTCLGEGSFGEVVEALWAGTPCAAKRLHRVSRKLLLKQQSSVVDKFLKECKTWSILRHPNIVLFLGVVFEQEESPLPVLIIEKMDTSLSNFVLEQPKEAFPLQYKVSVLLQVSLALCYLHSQSFIHRDLTPNNILLDLESFKTKITDFGVTGIINSSASYQTSAPGCPAFMPPEVSGPEPKYNQKLDTFSFGNVVLFCSSAQWPEPVHPVQSRNGVNTILTEFERRAAHVEKMSAKEKELFLPLIKHCLENEVEKRPSSRELSTEMKKASSLVPQHQSSSKYERDSLAAALTQKEGIDNARREEECKSLAKELVALKEKVRSINTKCFDQSRQLRNVQEENRELRRSLKSQPTKENGTSNGHSLSISQNRDLVQELRELRKENMRLKTEQSPPKYSLLGSDLKLSRVRFQSAQFGSSNCLCQPPAEVRGKSPTPQVVFTSKADLPKAMHMASAVSVDKAIYIGGGYNASGQEDLTDIYKLDMDSGAWVIMPRRDPEHTTSGFAMAAHKGSLHVIGGEYSAGIVKKGSSVADKVLTLDLSSPAGRWSSKSVHSLTTPRYIPGATVHMDHLIVAGGRGEDDEPVPTLEVLSLEGKRPGKWWTVSFPLLSQVRPQLVLLKEQLIVVGKKSAAIKDTMETISTPFKDILLSDKKNFKKDIRPDWVKESFIPQGAAVFVSNDILYSVCGESEKGSPLLGYLQEGETVWRQRRYGSASITVRRHLTTVVGTGDHIYVIGGKLSNAKGGDKSSIAVDCTDFIN